MLGRTYGNEICSAARALEFAGERWSLLILRNAMFAGMTRFGEFEKSLGLAPNVLATRLAHFVEAGLMTTDVGADGHQTYQLTRKGADFKPVIIALTEWGDRYAAPDGAPIVYEHVCGGQVRTELRCRKCREQVLVQDVRARKTEVMEKLRGRKARRVRQVP